MKRFTDLFFALDETNQTGEKVEALIDYFKETPPEDAAWALYFLMGQRRKRNLNSTQIRLWTAEMSGHPLWLVEESYQTVGDLAETVALLLPCSHTPLELPLHRLVQERLLPLETLDEAPRKECLLRTWRELDCRQNLVWNKLLLGNFRVGVSRTLLVRALSETAQMEPAALSHRLMGAWTPSAAAYRRLFQPDDHESLITRPYPFYLAYPLDVEPETLGALSDWQAEWKWDGIRAQLIKREGQVFIWTRGEELVTDRYPEVHAAAQPLRDGTVLDGELLAWRDELPLPFGELQKRIGRKTVSRKLLAEVPVVFMAYDLLEYAQDEIRSRPLHERRLLLEPLIHQTQTDGLRLSPLVPAQDWSELRQHRLNARNLRVEGVMLKEKHSAYGVGRRRGGWWKWKIDPFSIDAVLVYAQRGHGRRADLYTDYTFAVWQDGELVPVAKAYSGLTDEEINEVDAFVRRNTVERFGPVRRVRPELVFQLHFEGIQLSGRHKSGVALRFPRMSLWRRDKQPTDADTLETLRALLHHPDGKCEESGAGN